MMEDNPAINDLIGNNPLVVMRDNHKNHAQFMATVFTIGNYELLARTIPWVYRAYSGHKFTYDYITIHLQTWLKAIDSHINVANTKEIKAVYNWMIDKHQLMISLSQERQIEPPPVKPDWMETKNNFLSALLDGDTQKCIEISNESIKTKNDIESFYLQIIQPVMYEIGMLWERGEISVAREHLASAIVSRILSTNGMRGFSVQKNKGKAVICASPNEFHEIGAWMISDVLEYEGWQVKYLGANMPKEDLIDLLTDFKPNLLALSVTMPYNILKTKEIISDIKSNSNLSKIKILIGGRAFNDTADLWHTAGADAFASDVQKMKAIVNSWL
jgi:methanogenic corrinoid protein MtbC1